MYVYESVAMSVYTDVWPHFCVCDIPWTVANVFFGFVGYVLCDGAVVFCLSCDPVDPDGHGHVDVVS